MPYKVLPDTTTKQNEIIDMVWKFRFINRHQVQKFFKYKDPRRLNEWFRDLVSKGYLGRKYSNKLLENTKPAIYHTGINGIRFLKTQNDYSMDVIQKLYRDGKREEPFKLR